MQANLLAATAEHPEAANQVYNVAVGEQTSLNELFAILGKLLALSDPDFTPSRPVYRDFRPGDVRFSRADIAKAASLLGYRPKLRVGEGLERAIHWYVDRLSPRARRAAMRVPISQEASALAARPTPG